MDGFINFLKPPGMTSHDAVNYFRKLLKIKKVGHTGTLDPGVSGVLPLCLGKATRLAEYLTEMPKKYRAEITLGITTDTYDAYGNITNTYALEVVNYQKFYQVLAEFRGNLQQIPPMVSAVRVKGKHLYELARKGIEIDRIPRAITIYDLSVFTTDWKLPYPKAILDIICSKGTYIRTLCHDIGQKLGSGAHMSFLIRTGSGPFSIEQSLTIEEISHAVEKNDFSFIQPLRSGIDFMPNIVINEKQRALIVHGNMISLPNNYFGGNLIRIEDSEKNLLAIGQVLLNDEKKYLRPLKVLTEK